MLTDHLRDIDWLGRGSGVELPASTLRRDQPQNAGGRVPISGPSAPSGPAATPPDHACDRGQEPYRTGRPRSPAGDDQKVTRARALIYEALQPAATAPGLPEPVKPKDVEAFAAKAPFHETFVAVTVEPLAE
jgi:hypothetical protein